MRRKGWEGGREERVQMELDSNDDVFLFMVPEPSGSYRKSQSRDDMSGLLGINLELNVGTTFANSLDP